MHLRAYRVHCESPLSSMRGRTFWDSKFVRAYFDSAHRQAAGGNRWLVPLLRLLTKHSKTVSGQLGPRGYTGNWLELISDTLVLLLFADYHCCVRCNYGVVVDGSVPLLI